MRTLLLLSTIMTVSAEPSGDWWTTMQMRGCEWNADAYNSGTGTNGKIVCPDGVYLSNVNLRYADLRGASLVSARLSGTDLRDADLRYADLRGASLDFADLRDADLRYAGLRDVWLLDVDLWNTVFSDSADVCVHINPVTIRFPPVHKYGRIASDKVVYYTKDLLERVRAHFHSVMPQILTNLTNEELLAELGKRSGLNCTALADAYQKNSDCCGQ